jgi:hypothetical protein
MQRITTREMVLYALSRMIFCSAHAFGISRAHRRYHDRTHPESCGNLSATMAARCGLLLRSDHSHFPVFYGRNAIAAIVLHKHGFGVYNLPDIAVACLFPAY